MADISINKFRTAITRGGATPATPGFAETEGQDPVNPSGSNSNHNPVTIGSPANGLSVTIGQVLSLGLASAGVTGALSGTDWSTFNGKIGGSLTSGRIPFATGANTLSDDSGLTWDNTLKSLSLGGFYLAPIHVGNRNVNNSSKAQILISRTINSSSGNDHAFSDSSEYAPTADGLAYNSFDAIINISGSNNIDHYAAFQDGVVSNHTGIIDDYWSLITVPTINSGTITRHQHIEIRDIIGSGTITSQYGLRIKSLTKGSNNWAIYTEGTTPSYFAGNVGIGVTIPTDKLDINGTLRVRSLTNASGDFATYNSNGVLQKRTASQAVTDLGIFDSSGVANRIAFYSTSSQLTSNSLLSYDPVNFTFRAGSFLIRTQNSYSSDAVASIYGTLSGGTEPFNNAGNLVLSPRNNSTNRHIYLSTFDGTSINWRWVVRDNGELRGNTGTSLGVNIGASSPTNTLDVNGTARIRTISNLGSTATRFLVASATGVISERTGAELVSDLGISGGSNWTIVGSDIYRNSSVAIGRTTIPTASTFAVQSRTATATDKYLQFLNNSGTELLSQTQDGRVQITGVLSVGTTPVTNITGLFRSQTDTNASVGLRVQNQSGTTLFTIDGNSVSSFPNSILGVLDTPISNFGLTVKSQSAGGGILWLVNSTGTSVFDIINDGTIRSAVGAYFGNKAAPTGRVNIRGTGTTTGNTLLLEDSAGSDTFAFLDNGNLSIPSTNGAKIGTATSQKIGFWNATPIVQPTTAVAAATLVSNAGTTLTSTDTFDGYTLQQVVKALRNTGLLA